MSTTKAKVEPEILEGACADLGAIAFVVAGPTILGLLAALDAFRRDVAGDARAEVEAGGEDGGAIPPLRTGVCGSDG